jgi:6-methylpretetramide 4-monooxygenase / 4-hydroxy-6-methylpretetramide 12a-monooxygenase
LNKQGNAQEGSVSQLARVLIVGAGPTGLTIAHELARDGITCRVVDKSAHRAMESRAIAIHPRTVEMFELMGLAEDFLRAGDRITGVSLYGESERIAHAGFGMLETRYPFVLGLPQDETERILEERVTRRGVQVERNKELIGVRQLESGVSARLRTAGGTIEDIDVEWLLGCEGRTARFATS